MSKASDFKKTRFGSTTVKHQIIELRVDYVEKYPGQGESSGPDILVCRRIDESGRRVLVRSITFPKQNRK